jgi:dienelactone hydrolase
MAWLRRIGTVMLVIAVVAVLAVAWEPTRTGIQTAVLLPNLLDAGPKPLSLFSEAPQRMAVEYRPATEDADGELAELWLPAWASSDERAGAMLLVLGVNNVGRNHPVVARVADGLARTGVAVLVPDSRVLLEGRLEVAEVDGVVRAYELLAARPEVDPERVGIVGFSVGGSLALLAAADSRIADDVRWVNAFGAFADAETYLAAVSAHAYRSADGTEVAWTPSELAREIYLRFVLDQVPDAADRAALDDALGLAILTAERPQPDPELRASLDTDVARTIHDLLTSRSLADAERAIDALPPASLTFIDAISPGRHAAGLRADVHLMHETEDHHVPFVESRALATVLGQSGLLRSHTEFRLFDHVQPDDVDLVAAAPELVKLLLHLRTLIEESL